MSFIFSATVYEKVVLPASSGALCLDGSPGAYYLSQGDPNKILLSFEGGGWCGGVDLSSALEDCYQRSKTGLGSSKDYPSSVAVDEGILSDNQNNYFRAWTRVHFKYCTGTGHQGYKTSSIPYKDANLYFRGHNVTIGLLNSVD